MKTVVCSDLDRTLIYSAAALGWEGPDETLPRLLCVEHYRAEPLSYVTETAARLLERLADAAVLVPVTTRTPEQYRRVRLLEKPPPYAICANGGHILVDGVADPEWAARVRSRLRVAAELAEVHGHLTRVSGEFVRTVRTASDLFCYAVVERAALPDGWLADLTGWCAERGWRTSLQGRKVYCIPDGLSKAAAAAEVAHRTGAGRMLAAGDSLLDVELLEAADAALRPAHGELADVGWTAPRTAVTAARGVAAGEEIAERLLALALDPDAVPAAGTWRALLHDGERPSPGRTP
ncbi:HAD family hydrolase [Thermomonospora catenispora]|mgnify:CR=1 FL=1|uniref:HAD family hydrolase n=1 Tax=Thermomonospora catenispora TaxID=2493090 RepID=UPI0011205948|nr:HAD family hydrolase [Thermomonospora catenispora]TNY35765.1 HAD family hydrolase [Thermomonospora catenispora]